MKKIITLLLSLGLFLVGCSKSTGSGNGGSGASKLKSVYTIATEREVTNMDYTVTALQTDHEINANLVEGLLENDPTSALVPDIAESYTKNEDASVWTFKIRPGVKWVTSTGEEYAEVTAEDFVTGVRHGAEFESGTAWLLEGVIAGYSDYLTSDFSDDAWSKVGIKALDDYTLEFTMEAGEDGQPISVPYFDTMTTYAVLFPVNKQFLESKGTGCKLGAPDKENCTFGNLAFDSILYNGPYILTVNDAKSQAVLEKNASYWDAEHVYLDKIVRIYDAGEDPYSVIKGFEQGVYDFAALVPSWDDYDQYLEKYKENAVYTLPNATTFGIVFNYNRQSFNITQYATDETEKANTIAAIRNENFRKALRSAYDVVAYRSIGAPKDLAVQTQRNINNFPEAGTLSDGTKYFDLVTKQYNEDTGENVNLNDAETPFLSKEKALAYVEAAKAEGITFPVHLDMLVNNNADTLVKQAKSMKQSVEENTDGQIVIELNLVDADTIKNVAYYNQDPAASDYDISTYTGWGPDYGDPKSFVDIYSPVTGYYMTSMGLGTTEEDRVTVADLELKTQLGFMEYEKLYRAADAITDNLDERYKAFAKADAFLLEKALYIPTSQQTRSQRITKVVPGTFARSPYGVSEYKMKYIQVQEDLIKAEDYNKIYGIK